ncbi:MAG: SCO family protein [Candidatus Dormibacteria bacterium]
MTRRLLALLTLATALLAACGGATSSSSPAGYYWTGGVLQHALAKPEFTLTDQQGQPYDLQQKTAGKVALVYFGYTHCPDVCPEDMTMLAIALKQMPDSARNKVVVLFITTDPARDTSAVLGPYLSQFNPTFVGLTGTKAQVDLAQAAAQVTIASPEPATPGSTYYVDHSAQIIAYTPDNLAHVAFFQGMPTANIAHDLTRLATQGFSAS